MWTMISVDLMLVGSLSRVLITNRHGFFFQIGELPLNYRTTHGFPGMVLIVLIAAPCLI